MKEGQEAIYYMAADSKLAAESAPFVEQLVKRDFEVGFTIQALCRTSNEKKVTKHVCTAYGAKPTYSVTVPVFVPGAPNSWFCTACLQR